MLRYLGIGTRGNATALTRRAQWPVRWSLADERVLVVWHWCVRETTGVVGGRRTRLVQRMARWRGRRQEVSSGRGSRRGAPDAGQPQSSRTRIRAEGCAREYVGVTAT